MRKIYLIPAFIFLCLIQNSYAQSGWFWQNPLPQGNDLYCVKYVNSTTAFASGDCGTILKTTDGGINWKIIRLDSGFATTSLYFQNANTGYALSCTDYDLGSCKIAKTTDGGNTWTSRALYSGRYTYKLEFTSENTGYFTARDNNTGYIYKTTDSGENWFLLTSQSNKFIFNTCFLNNLTGYSCGHSGINMTTDGGLTWNNQYPFSGYPGSSINSITFLNANTGIGVGVYSYYMGSSQLILKTTNSGINWIQVTGVGNITLDNVKNTNSNFLIASGSNTIIKSTNSGSNWYSVTINSEVSYLKAVDLNGQNGFVTGYYGAMMHTSDFGETWTRMFPSIKGSYTTCVRFLNKNTGYVTSDKNVFKTTNGGINWFSLYTPAAKELHSISIVDSNIVYAAGGDSQGSSDILKSTNSGLNWEILNPNNSIHCLSSIYFVNNDTGFCCGCGVISKTTNGGINWTNNTSITAQYFYSINFVDENTGYASAYDGGYKTTDCGNTWSSIPIGSIFHCIYFLNANTGFVGGYNMQIKKTTNGGVSWITKTQAVSWYLNSIHFINEFTGFAVGDFGAILKTTDAGETWVRQNSLTNNFLKSVYMTDSNECYAVGDNGAILKTTTGGNPTIGISTISTVIPKEFSLYQNYPNPFNPTTKIKFDISKQSLAKITVYDLLGKEVSVLVNEELQPGTYSADWNGSNYPSGIYFYSLEIDSYKETRKMLLLK